MKPAGANIADETGIGIRHEPRNVRDRLIVALDVGSCDDARAMASKLGDAVTYYKIGMQLVFAGGLALIPELRSAGKRVFLDMKLLDIDNTVTNAVQSIVNIDVNMTTIHAYPKTMVAAAAGRGTADLCLLAVTVLTSMDDGDLAQAGYRDRAADRVAARSGQAEAAGMGGIVCSPLEAAGVRTSVGPGPVIVTPGIRPAGAPLGDQKRAMGPAEAVAAGADYLVVGRPVVQAADPVGAANAIVEEMDQTMRGGN